MMSYLLSYHLPLAGKGQEKFAQMMSFHLSYLLSLKCPLSCPIEGFGEFGPKERGLISPRFF